MRYRLIACALVPLLLGVPAAARAQNNTDRQMMADMRMLHEELQQARLLMAALAEQLKATNARLDAMERTVVKGFADQKLDLDTMTTATERLTDKVSENSVRVGQFASELTSIREGIGMSNTLLNQILGFVQPPPLLNPDAPNPANPTGAAAPPTLPPLTGPPTGAAAGTTPQSAVEAYTQGRNLYFGGNYELAAERLQMFVRDFPSDPNAASALNMVAKAQYTVGAYQEAIAASKQLIEKYPSSELVPEAHYNEGLCYLQLKDVPAARRELEQAIALAPPESGVALQAKQQLQKIGGTGQID